MGYNHLSFLSVDEMIKIRETIHDFHPKSLYEYRDKRVLELYFLQGMSSRKISESNIVGSKKNDITISARQVTKIVNKYFPGLLKKRYKPEDNKLAVKRKAWRETTAYKRKFNPNQCCKCQQFGDVDMHHMIPVFLGGVTDEMNLIPLCESCHSEITRFQQENRNIMIDNFKKYNNIFTEEK